MRYWILLILVVLIVGCTEVLPQEIKPEKPVQNTFPEEIVENVYEPEVVKAEEVPEKPVAAEPIIEEVILEEPIQTQFYNDTRWMMIGMQNAVTNEIFTVDDLKGKIIFVETYSRNCYPCGEQKLKLQEFISEKNNSIIHISMNTDPNADIEEVLKTVDFYNYDWPFVLASKELRSSITKQFGNKVLRYDHAPLILICEDQSAYLLGDGIKGEFQLNEALKKCS